MGSSSSSGVAQASVQQQQQQEARLLSQLKEGCLQVTVDILQALYCCTAASGEPAAAAAAGAPGIQTAAADSIQALTQVVAVLLQQYAETLALHASAPPAAAAAGDGTGGSNAAVGGGLASPAERAGDGGDSSSSSSSRAGLQDLTAEALASCCFVTVLSKLQLLLVQDPTTVSAAAAASARKRQTNVSAAAAAAPAAGQSTSSSSTDKSGSGPGFGASSFGDVSWGIAKGVLEAAKQVLQQSPKEMGPQQQQQQQQLVVNAVLAAASAGIVLLPDIAEKLLSQLPSHCVTSVAPTDANRHAGGGAAARTADIHSANSTTGAAAAGGVCFTADTAALVLRGVLGGGTWADAGHPTTCSSGSSSSSLGCDPGVASALCRLQRMLPPKLVCRLLQMPLLAAVLAGMHPHGLDHFEGLTYVTADAAGAASAAAVGAAAAAAAVDGVRLVPGSTITLKPSASAQGPKGATEPPGSHLTQQQQQQQGKLSVLPAAIIAAVAAVVSHPPLRSCLLSDVRLLYSKLVQVRPSDMLQLLSAVEVQQQQQQHHHQHQQHQQHQQQQLWALPQRLALQSILTGCLHVMMPRGQVLVVLEQYTNGGSNPATAAGSPNNGSSSSNIQAPQAAAGPAFNPNGVNAAAGAAGEGSLPASTSSYLQAHVEVLAGLPKTLDQDVAWVVLRVLLAEELWLQVLGRSGAVGAAGEGGGGGSGSSRLGSSSSWGAAGAAVQKSWGLQMQVNRAAFVCSWLTLPKLWCRSVVFPIFLLTLHLLKINIVNKEHRMWGRGQDECVQLVTDSDYTGHII
jgi:hypothetical protein